MDRRNSDAKRRNERAKCGIAPPGLRAGPSKLRVRSARSAGAPSGPRPGNDPLSNPSSALPGKPARVQKCPLVRGGEAAEQLIAMRKAPEAADDVGVLDGEFHPVDLAGRLE